MARCAALLPLVARDSSSRIAIGVMIVSSQTPAPFGLDLAERTGHGIAIPRPGMALPMAYMSFRDFVIFTLVTGVSILAMRGDEG
jgi:hypothetical protein